LAKLLRKTRLVLLLTKPELDDYFGGDPIQHREVCGHESPTFLNYFPSPIRLSEGGVESGFNHVKPETFEPRLLWLKGKKNVRTVTIDMKLSNLNSGDVFILDAGLMLYQFQGKKAGSKEKSTAGTLARAIDDERKGKPEVEVFSQLDKPDDTMGKFFSYFAEDCKDEGIDAVAGEPIKPDDCAKLLAKISDESSDDAAYEKSNKKKLMQLSDSSGEMKMTEVSCKKSSLKSEDVFIFDTGMEIFIWIGKGASEEEKKKGFTYASIYLKKNELNMGTPCTQILEGGENEVFEAQLS